MKDKRVYIADRFKVIDNRGYEFRFTSFRVKEIVTADSELCKRRESELDLIVSDKSPKEVIELFDIPLNDNEQYLYTEEVTGTNYLNDINGFEYCGIDILDKFNTNSWITNYEISYDCDKNIYTDYGLMKDMLAAEKWLSKRKTEKKDLELELNEYKFIAVWRKII